MYYKYFQLKAKTLCAHMRSKPMSVAREREREKTIAFPIKVMDRMAGCVCVRANTQRTRIYAPIAI